MLFFYNLLNGFITGIIDEKDICGLKQYRIP